MTKMVNFALKIKGGGREGGTSEVLRPCHPPKIWNVHLGSLRSPCIRSKFDILAVFGRGGDFSQINQSINQSINLLLRHNKGSEYESTIKACSLWEAAKLSNLNLQASKLDI